MAGQFCFCGDVARGIDVGVCEDAGGGLLGGIGGVLFVVDGDAGEQGAVEDASFGWFALVVELVEVDQEFGELVQACSGLGVGVGEVVEPGGDLVEAGADAVLSKHRFQAALALEVVAVVLAWFIRIVSAMVCVTPEVIPTTMPNASFCHGAAKEANPAAATTSRVSAGPYMKWRPYVRGQSSGKAAACERDLDSQGRQDE